MIETTNDILRNATLAVAREQEMTAKLCGRGILYKLKAMFSRKTFLEYQICMNTGVLRSFEIGIGIIEDGKKQFKNDPDSLRELEDGILLFKDLKDQWEKNLRRLKVHQNII